MPATPMGVMVNALVRKVSTPTRGGSRSPAPVHGHGPTAAAPAASGASYSNSRGLFGTPIGPWPTSQAGSGMTPCSGAVTPRPHGQVSRSGAGVGVMRSVTPRKGSLSSLLSGLTLNRGGSGRASGGQQQAGASPGLGAIGGGGTSILGGLALALTPRRHTPSTPVQQ